MTYDHWKSTNPTDEFLGPEPEDEEMTPTEYFREANKITEWFNLGLITLDEAAEREAALEQKRIQAIGRIQFASAGAIRKR